MKNKNDNLRTPEEIYKRLGPFDKYSCEDLLEMVWAKIREV